MPFLHSIVFNALVTNNI